MSIFRHNPKEIDVAKLDLERAPSSPLEFARELLGPENIFSPKDAVHYFGLVHTPDNKKLLETIPFSEQELKECKDTHMLVAILPISILNLSAVLTAKNPGTKFLYNTVAYKDEAFANEKGTAHWALIRKTPVPDSGDKPWGEQLVLLSPHEDVPDARDLIYSLFAHFQVTGERLFPSVYVRTRSLDSGRYHVSVGPFVADGLGVFNNSDADHGNILGVASARKSSGKKLETPIGTPTPAVPITRNF